MVRKSVSYWGFLISILNFDLPADAGIPEETGLRLEY
jgi:hypothetical protein